MADSYELEKAKRKLDELSLYVNDEVTLLKLVEFILLNASLISFNELNHQLDKLVSESSIENSFVLTLQTWYAALNKEQRLSLFFFVSQTLRKN